jgi:hypothetical protein
MSDDMPPPAVIAMQFVRWLEQRGAVLAVQPDGYHFDVNLDAVSGMTHDEAEQIASAVFDIRDHVRDVLRARRLH